MHVNCFPTVLLKNYFRMRLRMLILVLYWSNILLGMALAIPAMQGRRNEGAIRGYCRPAL